MSIQVTIGGLVTFNQADFISDVVSKELGEQFKVRPAEKLIRTKALGIVDAMTILGGMASLICLIFTLVDKYKDSRETNTWSISRVKKIIENELALRNIAKVKLDSVTGFGNLIRKGKGVCTIVASDEDSNRSYRISIFADGDAYVVNIQL